MKKFVILFLLLAVIASTALAAPMPRSTSIANTANSQTVYLGVRGKQTLREYPAAYVTITCTQACTVTFNATADAEGYWDGATSGGWSGASYSFYVEPGIDIAAGGTVQVKTSASSFTISGVSVSGAMEVTVEYEE